VPVRLVLDARAFQYDNARAVHGVELRQVHGDPEVVERAAQPVEALA
jgi:hypothetical protein